MAKIHDGKGFKNSAAPVSAGMAHMHAKTGHHIAAHGKAMEKSVSENAMHKGGNKDGSTKGTF